MDNLAVIQRITLFTAERGSVACGAMGSVEEEADALESQLSFIHNPSSNDGLNDEIEEIDMDFQDGSCRNLKRSLKDQLPSNDAKHQKSEPSITQSNSFCVLQAEQNLNALNSQNPAASLYQQMYQQMQESARNHHHHRLS